MSMFDTLGQLSSQYLMPLMHNLSNHIDQARVKYNEIHGQINDTIEKECSPQIQDVAKKIIGAAPETVITLTAIAGNGPIAFLMGTVRAAAVAIPIVQSLMTGQAFNSNIDAVTDNIKDVIAQFRVALSVAAAITAVFYAVFGWFNPGLGMSDIVVKTIFYAFVASTAMSACNIPGLPDFLSPSS